MGLFSLRSKKSEEQRERNASLDRRARQQEIQRNRVLIADEKEKQAVIKTRRTARSERINTLKAKYAPVTSALKKISSSSSSAPKRRRKRKPKNVFSNVQKKRDQYSDADDFWSGNGGI